MKELQIWEVQMLPSAKAPTEASLLKVKGVCSKISVFMRIAFALLALCWFLAVVFLSYSVAVPDAARNENANLATLSLLLVFGAVIGFAFRILINIFNDTAAGLSPFTLKQVKRLRLISVALVIYSALETVMAATFVFLHLDGAGFGYVPISSSANSIIPIDFAPLVVAAAIYAFSFVFKYGVLLQELSDETL